MKSFELSLAFIIGVHGNSEIASPITRLIKNLVPLRIECPTINAARQEKEKKRDDQRLQLLRVKK